MLRERYPYYLAGRPVQANADLVVTNKYTQSPAARVALADEGALGQAIAAATHAFEPTRRLGGFQRRDILQHVMRRCHERAEELAGVLAVEVGKPIRDARGEVSRLIDTLRIASEEAVRIGGEYLPLDISARAAGCEGIWRRFPIGPCAFVTPFNFPLNLAAHKIAPAIAAGCPWVLKPASNTPVSALLLAEMLAETDWPAEAFSVLPAQREVAELLVRDERVKLLSFTGSPEVGWALKSRAGRKRVLLELGGNAACIVERGVDLERAAERITHGAFYQSGQSCISVQRILIERSIYPDLRERLVRRAVALRRGDPLKEETDLGPLITDDDAARVESWIRQAVKAGATLLCGGRREGVMLDATYLEGVGPDQPLSCREVFGPVATLQPFDSFEGAVAMANASEFGLQCGVFTRDLEHARYAFRELEVGGVVVNDVPSLRVDSMPYGGVKQSGQGREGVRFAIEEMSEIKLLVLAGAGG
jgi:acyl-CoA reductase-like NAD-dependent aldehyde dehydrogenase